MRASFFTYSRFEELSSGWKKFLSRKKEGGAKPRNLKGVSLTSFLCYLLRNSLPKDDLRNRGKDCSPGFCKGALNGGKNRGKFRRRPKRISRVSRPQILIGTESHKKASKNRKQRKNGGRGGKDLRMALFNLQKHKGHGYPGWRRVSV